MNLWRWLRRGKTSEWVPNKFSPELTAGIRAKFERGEYSPEQFQQITDDLMMAQALGCLKGTVRHIETVEGQRLLDKALGKGEEK